MCSCEAAIALLKFKQPDRAWPMLDRLLRDPQAETRARTLEALGGIAHHFRSGCCSCRHCTIHPPSSGEQPVRLSRKLDLRQPLSRWSIELSDTDATVRAAAAQALQHFGSAATLSVLQALNSADVQLKRLRWRR